MIKELGSIIKHIGSCPEDVQRQAVAILAALLSQHEIRVRFATRTGKMSG